MAEETHYTANWKGAKIQTANGNLDGGGTLGTLITAASNGTLIKRVFIKALTSTSHGMIRFFITGGGNTRLLTEVEVPPITISSINKSFETIVELDFFLASGYILKTSTQNADTFWVIAEGADVSYYASSVREDTTQYIANMGAGVISTANSNLDGTGTIATIFTASSIAYTGSGSSIGTITIKGTVTNTPGMVRLYFYKSPNYLLFTEIPVPSVAPDATDQAFEHTVDLPDDIDLPWGFSIAASTQNAESFSITVESKDWDYAA